MSSEFWQPIPGLPQYEASNLGRIRSTWLRVRTRNGYALRRGRVLKPSLPCGRRIHMHVSTQTGTPYVHDLVALAFLGPKPPGSLVLHRDDDPMNNTPDNLRYGSKSENELDKHRAPVCIPADAPF